MSKRVRSVESEISAVRRGTFWGLTKRIWRLYIGPYVYEKIEKSNHRNSRFFSLKIVNRHKIKLSSWNDPTNFDH